MSPRALIRRPGPRLDEGIVTTIERQDVDVPLALRQWDAQVVVLDARRVLMAASCPRSAERVADLGYEPVVVDISEFEMLEGCVTCLSMRLRSQR